MTEKFLIRAGHGYDLLQSPRSQRPASSRPAASSGKEQLFFKFINGLTLLSACLYPVFNLSWTKFLTIKNPACLASFQKEPLPAKLTSDL